MGIEFHHCQQEVKLIGKANYDGNHLSSKYYFARWCNIQLLCVHGVQLTFKQDVGMGYVCL